MSRSDTVLLACLRVSKRIGAAFDAGAIGVFNRQELLGQGTAAQLTQVGELAQEPLALLFEVGVVGQSGFHIVVYHTTIVGPKTRENRKTDFYLVHPPVDGRLCPLHAWVHSMVSLKPQDTVCRGFHGTDGNAANDIVANGYRPGASESSYLGVGVYFFDDQLPKAKDWARKRRSFPDQGFRVSVLLSLVQLGRCLNLMDSEQCETVKWLTTELWRRTGLRVSFAAGVDIAAEKTRANVVRAARIPKGWRPLEETQFTSDVEMIICVKNMGQIKSSEIIWSGFGNRL